MRYDTRKFRSFNTASGRHCCNGVIFSFMVWAYACFNTASGRHCCNFSKEGAYNILLDAVSIPQAVGTVATKVANHVMKDADSAEFQYRKR